MTDTPQELDLILLDLLATTASVTLLAAKKIPVDILGEQREPRWHTIYQCYLSGTMRFTGCGKTKPQRDTSSLNKLI
jgi:hypothetical protein